MQLFRHSQILPRLSQSQFPMRRHFSPMDTQKPSIIKNIKGVTQQGKELDGNYKTNQDYYLIKKNINGVTDFNIYCVFDGHGEYGHFVSQYTSFIFNAYFTRNYRIAGMHNPLEIYKKIKENNYQMINDLFTITENCLKIQSHFDCSKSGTTIVLVIQINDSLICANVGDSKAILIGEGSPAISKSDSFPSNNKTNQKIVEVYRLSQEHKPNLPLEQERILKMGGKVEKMSYPGLGEVGPYRVFADGLCLGIAMSRSMGDFAAHQFGVISTPEIREFKLNAKAKFLIICSDGVYEFLSNEDLMKMGFRYYYNNTPEAFCRDVINRSTIFWEKESKFVDDMTIITVYF